MSKINVPAHSETCCNRCGLRWKEGSTHGQVISGGMSGKYGHGWYECYFKDSTRMEDVQRMAEIVAEYRKGEHGTF